MKEFHIKNAPNALLSRELLSNLSKTKEKRPGRIRNIFLFLAMGPIMTFIAMLIFGALNPPIIFIILIFIWFPISFYFFQREQVLVLQNYTSDLAEYTQPYLAQNEKVLSVYSGRILSLNIPNWLPNDLYQYSYFIFTTDRLLILIFSQSQVGKEKVTTFIENKSLDEVVLDIKSCDYIEENSCALGGVMLNIFAWISYTKIIVKPINETESYTWAIANKGTKSGQLLKEITARIRSKKTPY